MQPLSFDLLKRFFETEHILLQPTQRKLCFPIIQRIYRKMAMGIWFENINIDRSLLINGHHRYICSLLLQTDLERNDWKSPSRITIYRWSEVEIDLNDWESVEIVERHNTKDAVRNNLDIEAFSGL